MDRKILKLSLDLLMFSVGLAFTIAGSTLYNGRWIILIIGLILVAIPIKRSQGLGNFSRVKGINEKQIEVKIEKDVEYSIYKTERINGEINVDSPNKIEDNEEEIEIYEDEDGTYYYIDPDTDEEVPCDDEGNPL